MRAFTKTILLLVVLSSHSWASSTTTKQIDTIHATGGASLAVPSTGTSFSSDTNTLTLQNKTISGANNTLQQLPIGANEVQETPSGNINGSNTSFTLANTPPANSTVILYLDGRTLVQGSGNDYTISGATITMITVPAIGQKLYASYSKY